MWRRRTWRAKASIRFVANPSLPNSCPHIEQRGFRRSKILIRSVASLFSMPPLCHNIRRTCTLTFWSPAQELETNNLFCIGAGICPVHRRNRSRGNRPRCVASLCASRACCRRALSRTPCDCSFARRHNCIKQRSSRARPRCEGHVRQDSSNCVEYAH